MSIRRDDFEPQGYEDIVSVLLSRLHPDAQRIDGKGGDGGRDVQIVSGQDGQITDAFELKSFTGRMTFGRRKQVERSLKRAAALGPAQWTLVVPIDPTPAEEKWFRQLGTGYCFPTRWYGKTWLDGLCTKSPDFEIVLCFTSVLWCGYARYKEHINRSYILYVSGCAPRFRRM